MKVGDQIKTRLLSGQRYGQIMRELDVAASTIAYHAKKIGISRNPNFKLYNWAEVQAFYDVGHSIVETRIHFGMESNTLTAAKRRGDFKPAKQMRYTTTNIRESIKRGRRAPLDKVFVADSSFNTGNVKKIILRENLILYCCVGMNCPLKGIENPKWAGREIVLHLDHRNGIRADHRLDNLRFLCPNCHSQTATYCGRNKRP